MAESAGATPNRRCDDRERADRFARALKKASASSRAATASRLLRWGLSHRVVPSGPKLAPWLETNIGARGLDALVRRYAAERCMGCTRGFEPCAGCAGAGFDADGDACRACLTLGVRRCPFCWGSGLLGYDAMPPGLRPLIGAMRLATASKAIGRFGAARRVERAGLKPRSLALQLLAIESLRGVIDNARSLQSLPPGTEWKRAAAGGDAQTRTLLRALAAAAESHANERTPARAAQQAARAALLRRAASSPTFAGSMLDRANLRAVAR